LNEHATTIEQTFVSYILHKLNYDRTGTSFSTLEYHIAVFGDSKVGKTEMCKTLALADNRSFKRMQNPKKGLELFPTRRKIDPFTIKLELWEYSENPKFQNELSDHIKRVQGAILMYDVTDRDSFARLKEFLLFIKQNTTDKIFFMILGNKVDLEKKKKVTTVEAAAFAVQNRALFFEISAKKKIGLEEALMKFADHLVNNVEKSEMSMISPNTRHQDSLKETTYGDNVIDDVITKETKQEFENEVSTKEYAKSSKPFVELDKQDRAPCCTNGCSIF